MTVTLDDIRAAASRIAGHVVQTPLVEDAALSARLGRPVRLKCEYRQTTGAFKLRGATNAILSLQGKVRGVVTASTGNHGRAVAHAAGAQVVVGGDGGVRGDAGVLRAHARHATDRA